MAALDFPYCTSKTLFFYFSEVPYLDCEKIRILESDHLAQCTPQLWDFGPRESHILTILGGGSVKTGQN